MGLWGSRLPSGAEEQFRSAVRMAAREFNAPESQATRIESSFRLIAYSLVHRADQMGVTITGDLDVTIWAKEFDFGAQIGIAGGAIGTFTATPRQFIHWLTVELERERARREALESWWGFRAWRATRRFWTWLGWPVRWLRPPLEDE